ncbi:MAG: transcriptional regulator [Gammaproteobacteria bacterium]|jgi:sigma-E factor negative regulatory protein RseB|nr:transcriptional regulator [Gammaproteobacteria bacterium]
MPTVRAPIGALTQLWCRLRRELRSLPLAILALLWLLWTASAHAGDDPRLLLERMNQALEQVQFEGTLVYLHGGDLAALRVSHRRNNGMPGESLLSLTGPVRALSRHAQGVTCMLPDAAPLTVSKGHGHSRFLRSVPLDFPQLRRHYRMESLGRFRIAGRDTRVVGVHAKDDYRYGYRFYIDEASGLPLKVDLLNSDGQAVQQIMFTDIDIDIDREPAGGQRAVAPPVDAPSQAPAAMTGSEAEAPQQAGVVATQLPPGFRIISRDRLVRDDGKDIHQRVASDGLASFSIYVEPPMHGALMGQSRLGAVTAAGGRVGGHQVTVVGEVPPATAQMVLEHIEVADSP